VVSELIARRGYARVQARTSFEEAWRTAAGEMLAKYTRVGAVKHKALEVFVANSTLIQELTFQKQALLKQLTQLLPDETIADLRFKVGAIE
jgi:predicted nucleic acid-binding Zn ribbon protein